MATAGSERGLSLRSPARYTEAAGRLVDLYAERLAADPVRPPGRRTPWPRPGWTPRPTGSPPYWTATRVLDGGYGGRRGQRQQDPLVGDRPGHPPGRARPARARGRSSTATAAGPGGWTATCSPWPGRSTPGPTRSSGTWWPSACSACPGAEGTTRALRLHRPAARVPRRRAPGARQGVHPRRPAGRLRGPGRPRSRAGPPWPRWGWWASPSPSAHGGLGMGLLDLVLLLEEAGRVALPEPLLETTRPGRPPAGRVATRRAGRAGSTGSPPGTWSVAVAPVEPVGEPGRRGGRRRPGHRPPVSRRRPSCTPCPGRRVDVTPVPSLDPTRRLGHRDLGPLARVTAGGRRRRPTC